MMLPAETETSRVFTAAMDRKDFFKTGLSSTAKSVYNSKIGGIVDRQLQSFANMLGPFAEPPQIGGEQPTVLSGEPAAGPESDQKTAPTAERKRGLSRPPGSVRDPERFRQICTDCGDCIVACPYGAILHAPGVYGPVVNPNLAACALCEDYPCIQSCDTHALLPIPEGFLPKFGHAMLDPQKCRNIHGSKKTTKASKKAAKKTARRSATSAQLCQLCVEICPIPETVSLLPGPVRIPSFAHHCTGCGLCMHACPESAIRIEQA